MPSSHRQIVTTFCARSEMAKTCSGEGLTRINQAKTLVLTLSCLLSNKVKKRRQTDGGCLMIVRSNEKHFSDRSTVCPCDGDDLHDASPILCILCSTGETISVTFNTKTMRTWTVQQDTCTRVRNQQDARFEVRRTSFYKATRTRNC